MSLFSFGKISISESGVLKEASDRHSHILWGVDDGIKTREESLETLTYMESLGIRSLWLTPHIAEDMPNTTEALMQRFAELKEAYTGSISLNLAAEYMLDTLFMRRLSSRDLLTMEESQILIETSTWNPPMDIYGIIRSIKSAGYHPVLAHPERYRYMDRKDYEALHGMGVRMQMNYSALTGYYGSEAMSKAQWLIEKGMYSYIGSDCHRLEGLKRITSAKTSRKTINKIKSVTETI